MGVEVGESALVLKVKCSRVNKPLRWGKENPTLVRHLHSKPHFADFKF